MAENHLSVDDAAYFESAWAEYLADFPAVREAIEHGKLVVDSVTLKPCPFCGNVPEIKHTAKPKQSHFGEIDDPQETLSIYCQTCRYGFTRCHRQDGGIVAVVGAWNTRAVLSAESGTVGE